MNREQETASGEEKDTQSIIRLVTEKDLPQVAQLLSTVYQEAIQKYGTHFSLADEPVEAIEQQLVIDFERNNPIWIAQKENQIIGTVTLFTSFESKNSNDPDYMRRPTVAEIGHFAIANNHQGKGLGARMIAVVEETAQEKHLEGLVLVTAKGTALERYYRDLGFTDTIGTIEMRHHQGIALGKKITPNP